MDTYEETFLLVSRGRYDLCVCDRLTGHYFIKKLDHEGLKALEPPLATFELFHYLHAKHAGLVPKIAEVLTRMRTEGRLEAIRQAFMQETLFNSGRD